MVPTPRAAVFKRCDANITARKGTTNCAFASNVFYEYWLGGEPNAVRAYSPLTSRYFNLRCAAANGSVVCRTRHRGVVRFPQAAVDDYSRGQALMYARSHDVGPDPAGAESAPVPPPSSDQPPSSPDTPTAGFCSTHDCIPNFDEGNGSIVQCADGMWSQSGGIQGACSGHGGER